LDKEIEMFGFPMPAVFRDIIGNQFTRYTATYYLMLKHKKQYVSEALKKAS